MRGAVSDLCYLPDGRGVFAVGGRIEIWDLAEGKVQAKHQACRSGIVSVVPRKDGQVLLLADSAGKVHEWGLAARRALRSWPTKQSGLRRALYQQQFPLEPVDIRLPDLLSAVVYGRQGLAQSSDARFYLPTFRIRPGQDEELHRLMSHSALRLLRVPYLSHNWNDSNRIAAPSGYAP